MPKPPINTPIPPANIPIMPPTIPAPQPYVPGQVLRKPADWKNLRFYQKMDALFQLTYIFCQRFLPKYGDRTVDQMVQAARSGKQNIIEGSEDGKTSTEMELKLLNVARASVGELREDYRDHLNNQQLEMWGQGHPRFQAMQDFTKVRNLPSDYLHLANQWSEEEFCNICLTLCFQIDSMMNSYLKSLEETFIKEGGIKERMHKSRTGYRQGVDDRIKELESACAQWQAAYDDLRQRDQAAYDDLRQRALDAYNRQQQEISELKERIRLLESKSIAQ